MIRHCVLLTWKDSTTPEQIQTVIDGLGQLPGEIPEIKSYVFSQDLGLAPDNASLAVIGAFDDLDGYKAYATNKTHLRLLTEHIKPILAGRTACQFEF